MQNSQSLSFPGGSWIGVLTLAFTANLSGCIIEGDCNDACPSCDCSDTAGASGGTISPPEDVVLATIDTNQTLDTTPGRGIGAFIEYAEGGRWHVFTTCDTDLSGLPCYFSVFADMSTATGYSTHAEQLESEDAIYDTAEGLELATVTRSGIDGMYIDAPEGEVIRIEVWLDNEPDARFIYWVGGGAVHNGAPTNPLDLKPISA